MALSLFIIGYIGWAFILFVMPIRIGWLVFRYFIPSKYWSHNESLLFISRVLLFLSVGLLIYIFFSVFIVRSNNPGSVFIFYSIPSFFLYVISEILYFKSEKNIKLKSKQMNSDFGNLEEELISAVNNHQADRVETLVNEGANPNLKNELGYSALDYARGHGYDIILKYLQNNA